jgi:hypothetical protein
MISSTANREALTPVKLPRISQSPLKESNQAGMDGMGEISVNSLETFCRCLSKARSDVLSLAVETIVGLLFCAQHGEDLSPVTTSDQSTFTFSRISNSSRGAGIGSSIHLKGATCEWLPLPFHYIASIRNALYHRLCGMRPFDPTMDFATVTKPYPNVNELLEMSLELRGKGALFSWQLQVR